MKGSKNMNKTDYEQQQISVYWWNGGTKTLDYKGTYKGFLEEKGITVKPVISNKVKGWHFDIPLAFSKATLDTFDTDYSQCCNDAIKIFLTLLGDKSKFNTPRFEYFVNWR